MPVAASLQAIVGERQQQALFGAATSGPRHTDEVTQSRLGSRLDGEHEVIWERWLGAFVHPHEPALRRFVIGEVLHAVRRVAGLRTKNFPCTAGGRGAGRLR